MLLARSRNDQAIRLALVIGFLIGALLWRTEWPILQPGLWLLLAAQVTVAFIRLQHRATLGRGMMSLRDEALDERAMLAWFGREKLFVVRLSAWENGLRGLGFLLLAYGFWARTGQFWIALLLGIVYPAVAYLGMARRVQRSQLKRLELDRHETELDLLLP